MKFKKKPYLTMLLLSLVYVTTQAQQSVYSISFPTLTDSSVILSSLRGKVIIIYTIDAANPDGQQLRALKSVVDGDSGKIGLVVPVSDFSSGTMSANVKQALIGASTSNFIITAVAKASRLETGQHPLLQWLSKKDNNVHYDFEYQGPGQVLIINGKGELYANFISPAFKSQLMQQAIAAGSN